MQMREGGGESEELFIAFAAGSRVWDGRIPDPDRPFDDGWRPSSGNAEAEPQGEC
jgi:hypothetical protein